MPLNPIDVVEAKDPVPCSCFFLPFGSETKANSRTQGFIERVGSPKMCSNNCALGHWLEFGSKNSGTKAKKKQQKHKNNTHRKAHPDQILKEPQK